jgi:hypothetical protein
MLVYLMSVGLLRDGVGQTAGYSSLLLLPVFWAAVRSRRAELVVTLAGSAILLFAPLLLIGGAHYPISGWRTGALWIVVAAGLGIAVLAIVDQLLCIPRIGMHKLRAGHGSTRRPTPSCRSFACATTTAGGCGSKQRFGRFAMSGGW